MPSCSGLFIHERLLEKWVSNSNIEQCSRYLPLQILVLRNNRLLLSFVALWIDGAQLGCSHSNSLMQLSLDGDQDRSQHEQWPLSWDGHSLGLTHVAGCRLGARPRLPTGHLHLVFPWGLAISVPWGHVPRLSVFKGSSSLRLIGSYSQKSQNAISVSFCWSVRSLMESTDLRGQETPLLNGRIVKNVWPSLISTPSFCTPTGAHAQALLGPMKTGTMPLI